MRRLSKQAGIGLLEIMLVLALIAIILVLVTSYYQVANRTRLVNSGYQDLQVVTTACHSWWNDHSKNFKDLTTIDTLIEKGYLNKEYKKNPWGGEVSVKGISIEQAQIRMTNVEPKACYALALRFGIEKGDICAFMNINSRTVDLTICTSDSKKYEACTS